MGAGSGPHCTKPTTATTATMGNAPTAPIQGALPTPFCCSTAWGSIPSCALTKFAKRWRPYLSAYRVLTPRLVVILRPGCKPMSALNALMSSYEYDVTFLTESLNRDLGTLRLGALGGPLRTSSQTLCFGPRIPAAYPLPTQTEGVRLRAVPSACHLHLQAV